MAHLALSGDFAFPNRADLMSLQTINSKQDQTKTNTAKLSTNRAISNNLQTNDIQGAAPKLHGSKQTNKPEFTNTNWDIDRSGPRALHIGLYKEETNLKTNDIFGAQPQIVKFQSKRQGNDPLNPTYSLAQVEVRPATPPRFIRDAMSIDDIDKAKPKQDLMQARNTKDVLKVDDIEGTKARLRHKPRGNAGGYTSYDYTDVTRQMRVSQRCSNPLDPTYTVSGDDGKTMEIGSVDGSKPARMPEPPRNRDATGGSLMTTDIQGAQTSTKGLGVFAGVKRREDQMKSTSLDTKNVFGAQAGTLLKGPKTKRQGNPLDGNYQYPGWTELKDNINPYSVTKREDAKKQSTLQKTGAAAMGINSGAESTNFAIEQMPEHKQKAFKESYANFYGVENDAAVNKLSFNKLHAASRSKKNIDPLAGVPAEVRADPNFKKNQKVFFQNEVSDTQSNYNAATAQFFGDAMAKSGKPEQVMGGKFQQVQDRIMPANMDGEGYKQSQARFMAGEDAGDLRSTGSVFARNKAAFFGQSNQEGFHIDQRQTASAKPKVANEKSGIYKRDAAAFYGDDKYEVESQGTQFQQNAAAFMGTDVPASGERPFKIDKNAKGSDYSKVKGNSVLNEQRLREHEMNMQRDPNFKKNMKRFHAVPSAATRSVGPMSAAEKLDSFIAK